MTGHTNMVVDAAFSHDSKIVATRNGPCKAGPPDPVIRLWDTASGASLAVLQGHSDFLSSIMFTPDDQMLVSASYDGTVRLWQVISGVELRVFSHPIAVTSAMACGDGTTLISATEDGTMYVWSVLAEEPLYVWPGASPPVCANDGRTAIVAGGDHAVHFLDIASGNELRSLGTQPEPITKIVTSASGEYLAAISEHNTVLWKVDTATAVHDFGATSRVVFSADSSLLATVPHGSDSLGSRADRIANIWDIGALEQAQSMSSVDLASFAQVQSITGHTAPIEAIEFSPDGRRLLTAADGEGPSHSAARDYTIRMWDLQGALRDFRARNWGYVGPGSLSQDGRMIAASGRIWDTESGLELQRMASDDSDSFRRERHQSRQSIRCISEGIR